jgi:hypothetical protein
MEIDPIHYPTVLIDGKQVEVKFRCGDILRMKKAGVDIFEAAKLKGAEAVERMLTLLQYGVAHQMQKTVEELADGIDLGNLAIYSLAVTEAIKKVSPQAAAALATLQAMAPKTETETIQ